MAAHHSHGPLPTSVFESIVSALPLNVTHRLAVAVGVLTQLRFPSAYCL